MIWTPEQTSLLRAMRAEHRSYNTMAKQLGFPAWEIKNKLLSIERRPPFEVGQKVRVEVDKKSFTYGQVLVADGKPILAYRDYSALGIREFDKSVDCTQVDWLSIPKIHYV